MKNKEIKHIPVLLEETLTYLSPQKGDSYLDLTAGYGGHADATVGGGERGRCARCDPRDCQHDWRCPQVVVATALRHGPARVSRRHQRALHKPMRREHSRGGFSPHCGGTGGAGVGRGVRAVTRERRNKGTRQRGNKRTRCTPQFC